MVGIVARTKLELNLVGFYYFKNTAAVVLNQPVRIDDLNLNSISPSAAAELHVLVLFTYHLACMHLSRPFSSAREKRIGASIRLESVRS
eukprot:SAG31_NODE_616_length_13519_cov_2.372876_14_plen_89_part_00